MPAPRGAGRRGRRGAPAEGPRYPRVARVNELLREVVAEGLEAVVDDDPRLRMVTVTGVDTEPDLRRATVYFTALDEGAKEALDEQRRDLQAAVAREVRLKRTPQLAFVPDPAVAQGRRIEDILRGLPGTGAPDTAEAPGGTEA